MYTRLARMPFRVVGWPFDESISDILRCVQKLNVTTILPPGSPVLYTDARLGEGASSQRRLN